MSPAASLANSAVSSSSRAHFRTLASMEIAEEVLGHNSNFTSGKKIITLFFFDVVSSLLLLMMINDIEKWLAEELETCNFNCLKGAHT